MGLRRNARKLKQTFGVPGPRKVSTTQAKLRLVPAHRPKNVENIPYTAPNAAPMIRNATVNWSASRKTELKGNLMSPITASLCPLSSLFSLARLTPVAAGKVGVDPLLEMAAGLPAPQLQQLSKLSSWDSPHLHFHMV